MFIWRETFCAKGTFESFPRQKHFWQFVSYQNYVVGWDARLYIWGSLCYHKLLYEFLLGPTSCYSLSQRTGFSLCFPRSWLVENVLGLTGSRFWLVERCQGLLVLHWSGYCTQFLSLPQCLFMWRERWSDLKGLTFIVLQQSTESIFRIRVTLGKRQSLQLFFQITFKNCADSY